MINNFLFLLNVRSAIVCLFLFFQMTGMLWAGTVIESRDLEGNVNTLTVSGEQVRLEFRETDFMLIDLKENKYYTVEPEEERIINMSSFYSKPIDALPEGESGRIEIKFKKVGKGPKIAGYATTHYKMMVNDFICADEYLSTEAYAIPDLKTLFKVYAHLSGREATMGVSGDGDPCERLEFEMSEEQYARLGVPMRTVSRDGHIDHEVMAIKTDVTIAKKTFSLPSSYTTLAVENLYKIME